MVLVHAVFKHLGPQLTSDHNFWPEFATQMKFKPTVMWIGPSLAVPMISGASILQLNTMLAAAVVAAIAILRRL